MSKCGDRGGKNSKGEPCGQASSTEEVNGRKVFSHGGLCARYHKDQEDDIKEAGTWRCCPANTGGVATRSGKSSAPAECKECKAGAKPTTPTQKSRSVPASPADKTPGPAAKAKPRAAKGKSGREFSYPETFGDLFKAAQEFKVSQLKDRANLGAVERVRPRTKAGWIEAYFLTAHHRGYSAQEVAETQDSFIIQAFQKQFRGLKEVEYDWNMMRGCFNEDFPDYIGGDQDMDPVDWTFQEKFSFLYNCVENAKGHNKPKAYTIDNLKEKAALEDINAVKAQWPGKALNKAMAIEAFFLCAVRRSAKNSAYNDLEKSSTHYLKGFTDLVKEDVATAYDDLSGMRRYFAAVYGKDVPALEQHCFEPKAFKGFEINEKEDDPAFHNSNGVFEYMRGCVFQ